MCKYQIQNKNFFIKYSLRKQQPKLAISIYFLFGAGLGDDVTRGAAFGMSALDPLSPGGEDLSTLSQDSESDLLPDSSGDEASLDGDSDSDSATLSQDSAARLLWG